VAEVSRPGWRRKYRTAWYKRPVHLLREALSSGFHVGTIRKLVKLCKTWRIDVVHTNTALNIQGATAARLCAIPHVWHIRELVGNQSLHRFWLPDRQLAATFVRLSNAVIANSEETRKFFTRHGFHNRVDLIYNGLDLDPFFQDTLTPTLRAAWNVGNEPLIGMVANLTSRWKKHETFIRMAALVRKQHPDAKFVIVGHDPTKSAGPQSEQTYTQQLKRLSKTLGLDDYLIWAGKCADIPAVMRSLDIVVHPSGQESFGRVGVEAMAAAKPMVAAREGGLGEVIADGVTGFSVPENDIEGFANAVVILIRDPDLRNTLGIAGRERAKRLFTVEKMADQFEAVYRRVLKSDTITATNRAEMSPTVAVH
jgi:glycosyltransferase involved in cell wall biosynthesis